MITATARKTSVENEHLPSCGHLRLLHPVCKICHNWTGVQAFELNKGNY